MNADKLTTFLESNRRTLASIAAAVLLFNGLLAVSRGVDGQTPAGLAGSDGLVDPSGAPIEPDAPVALAPDGTPLPPGTVVPGTVGPTLPGPDGQTPVEGVPPAGGGLVTGVTDTEISVVYYWKGERTMTSPFVNGTGAEGQNLDESLAFDRYIEFINKHADGSATFMGHRIDLHGRRLVGQVLEAGNGDFSYSQTAKKITDQIKPFAAISSHGSLSAYICPDLATAGIFNISTYDLGGKGGTLADRTNGFCTPSGLTWERQVDLTIGYLKKHMHTKTLLGEDRVYGVVYATYPGLKDVGPKMIERLKRAGIPVAADYRLPPDLANAGTKGASAVDAMRNAGVNTVIMPDAGAPLTFTHAAEAARYSPDYYIWPCSGQDQSGMVRLFSPVQWENAEGLTCYDYEFNPDLTNNAKAERTEWWRDYQEMAGQNKTPPAPSPNVYFALWQLVVGVSGAGPDLTPETFKAALDDFKPYRYDAIQGRTNDPSNMWLNIDADDRSAIGDAGKLYWTNTERENGGATQGRYVYPEDRRYRRPSQF